MVRVHPRPPRRRVVRVWDLPDRGLGCVETVDLNSGALAQLGEHLLCKQGGRRFDPDRLHHPFVMRGYSFPRIAGRLEAQASSHSLTS